IVCKVKGDKFNKLTPYKPHADIINEVAEDILRLGLAGVCKRAKDHGIFFPDFEEGIDPGHRALDKVEGGYVLRTRTGLVQLLENRANIGDIVYNQIEVKGAHDPIMDKALYEAVLSKIKGNGRKKHYYHKNGTIERIGILKPILRSERWRI